VKGLKQKVISGLFWSVSEKFGFAAIQFVVVTILARLLEPSDFGMIACLSIFIGLSNALVESGFSQALIYKQAPTHSDYSSVFFVNIFMGTLMYAAIFFAAPLIAAFYKQPLLVDLTRVLCLVFLINSFSRIQNVLLVKEMSFKKLLMIRIPSFLIGGVVGIVMAYSGMGVWSLVYQQLTTQIINTIQFTFRSRWRPSFIFNLDSIKSLSAYGGNLMMSSVLNVLYSNIDSIFIGKFSSMTDVGFFQRAKSTKQLPINTLGYSLNSVTFSALSAISDDDDRLRRAYKQMISQAFFLLTPVLVGMAVLGKNIFIILFTEKWLPAVPYFQWLCFAGIFQIINSYNLNILKVKGRTDLFLRINLIRKVLESVVMFVAIKESIFALVVVMLIIEIIAYLFNSYLCGKFIDYTLRSQLRDLLPIIAVNSTMLIIMYALILFTASFTVTGLIGYTIIGAAVYVLLAYFLKLEVFENLRRQILPAIIS
jgi:teichuronic acid exporter